MVVPTNLEFASEVKADRLKNPLARNFHHQCHPGLDLAEYCDASASAGFGFAALFTDPGHQQFVNPHDPANE